MGRNQNNIAIFMKKRIEPKKKEKKLKKPKKASEKSRIKKEKRKAENELLSNQIIQKYLTENYGKKALLLLSKIEKNESDEKLAKKANLTVNETRAILNKLYEGGLVNYSTKQSKSGWYTYLWNVRNEKIQELLETKEKEANEAKKKDVYVCPKCFNESRIEYSFEEALNNKFKCLECGSELVHISFYEEVLQKNAQDNLKSGMGQPGVVIQNARRAHNPKVGGSNPPPAKNSKKI